MRTLLVLLLLACTAPAGAEDYYIPHPPGDPPVIIILPAAPAEPESAPPGLSPEQEYKWRELRERSRAREQIDQQLLNQGINPLDGR